MAKVSERKLKTIRTPYIDKDFKSDSLISEDNNQRNEVFINENNKNDKTTTTVSLDKSTNMGKILINKIYSFYLFSPLQ